MIIERTDSTNALGQVGQKEARRILKLLDDAITQARRSRREIERKLGWSQGYLGSLLRGRIGLKVWHVFALCRELGIEPMSLFLTAAPPRDPSWVLNYLGIPAEAPAAQSPPEPPKPVRQPLPLDLEELEEWTRALLHSELERLGLLDDHSR